MQPGNMNEHWQQYRYYKSKNKTFEPQFKHKKLSI